MVYPVELGAGVVLLAVGYHLHYRRPLSVRPGGRTESDESALAPDGGRTDRLSVVTEQAMGAAIGLVGLLLLVDGLGV